MIHLLIADLSVMHSVDAPDVSFYCQLILVQDWKRPFFFPLQLFFPSLPLGLSLSELNTLSLSEWLELDLASSLPSASSLGNCVSYVVSFSFESVKSSILAPQARGSLDGLPPQICFS